ncbi:MAG: hypothetical protein M1818_007871 [Claussenomyces sp. TS43310]|nr:MAG: hypothetical protein M1818_007871 [Claussenomyces sp. TS43310]
MSTEQSSQPHLTLYRGFEDRGCYVWSPFVTKLELRLRLSQFPYTVGTGSPTTAPKGKIPYVELGTEEGPSSVLGDSTLIIKHMVEFGYVKNLDVSKSSTMQAQDLAIRALLEDRLYFYDIQGTGRYTDDEIRLLKREIWGAINELLESSLRQMEQKSPQDEPFWCFGGATPTEADTVLYGFIVSVLVSQSAPESRKLLKGFPVIMIYAERIHVKHFPDYEKWEQ